MDERFPREVRITRGWEYAQIKERGTAHRGRIVVLSFLHVPSENPPRIGIIVSKRVGGAVVRNLVRRRLRNICRKERAHLLEGIQLVVIARPSAATGEFEEIRQDLLKVARRAAILTLSK